MIELTEVQIALIGIVALVIVQGLRLWKATTGTEFEQVTLTWIMFGIAVVLAYFFAAPAIPAFPVLAGDPTVIVGALFGWLATVVTVGAAILGFATLVYAVLEKAVMQNMVKKTLMKALKAQAKK